LSIFNIKGQKVKTLLDCKTAPGKYNCVWNGKDENGKHVSSGQYTARLMINGEEKAVRKIMMVK
jgi:flagellar hook assembly protein FlgD